MIEIKEKIVLRKRVVNVEPVKTNISEILDLTGYFGVFRQSYSGRSVTFTIAHKTYELALAEATKLRDKHSTHNFFVVAFYTKVERLEEYIPVTS